MHYSQYPPSPASFSSWGTIDTRSPEPVRPKSRASTRLVPLPPQTTPWSPASETYSCHSHFDDSMTRFSPTPAALRPVPLPDLGTPVTPRGHVPRLHPSLTYAPNPNIYCNVADPAPHTRSRDGNPLNPNDYACNPPASQMHVRVSGWPITITNPAGVTLGDVIYQIQSFFQSPISPQELHSIGAGNENAILSYAQYRRSKYPSSPHLTRGDVLCQRVWLYGLRLHSDGVSFEAILGNSPN